MPAVETIQDGLKGPLELKQDYTQGLGYAQAFGSQLGLRAGVWIPNRRVAHIVSSNKERDVCSLGKVSRQSVPSTEEHSPLERRGSGEGCTVA